MKKTLVIVLLTLITAGCATFGPKQSIERAGPGFEKLAAVEQGLVTGKGIDLALITEAEAIFETEQNLLGLSEANYWKGLYHAFTMKADNTDKENFDKATTYFMQAKAGYGTLKEQWLQARASYFLTYTYARASKWHDACLEFEKSMALLDSGKGQIREFIIINEDYSAHPQKHVWGVYGHNCGFVARREGREPVPKPEPISQEK